MFYRRLSVRSRGVLMIVSLLVVFGAQGQAFAESKPEGDKSINPPKQMSSAEFADLSSPETAVVGAAVSITGTELIPVYYYSPWLSDETPPFTCRNGYLIDFMQCSGSYCDNLAVRCYHVSRTYGATYWSSYFSEEGTYYRTCDGSSFMTGVHCKGSYCDSLTLQCTYLANTKKESCYWTSWFSEEYPSWKFLDPGYYAAGLACSGRYCDNKSIYACKAVDIIPVL